MTKSKIKSEVLLDNDYFRCTRSVDNEGRTEYGLSYYKDIKDTINRLVQLHLREANYLARFLQDNSQQLSVRLTQNLLGVSTKEKHEQDN